MIFTDVASKKAFVSFKNGKAKSNMYIVSRKTVRLGYDTTFILYQRICRAYNFVLLRQSFILIQVQKNVC